MTDLAAIQKVVFNDAPEAALSAYRTTLDACKRVRKSTKNQINEIVLDRPFVAMVSLVAFTVLGISFSTSALLALPFYPIKGSLIGSCAASCFSIAAMTVFSFLKEYKCIALSLIYYVTHQAVGTHCMDQQFFTEATFERRGRVWGRLNYVESIPVLKLFSSSPYEMGYAHGYLTGKNIHEMWKKYLKPGTNFLFHSWNGYDNLLQRARSLIIPPVYRKEMEGIADGYNAWRREQDKKEELPFDSRELTVNDIIAWHAFIDVYKGDMKLNAPIGCSTIALKDGNRMLLGRNLDWPSLGVVANHSLLIVRNPEGDHYQSAILTFAGTVGSLTGVNGVGLMTAVNEAGRKFKDGRIPYTLVHRRVLESCANIGDAEELIRRHPPASSHLMTVATPEGAAVFQFYAEDNKDYTTREIDHTGRLVVANHFADGNGRVVPGTQVSKSSAWRERVLSSMQFAGDAREAVEDLLKGVENEGTIHTVIADLPASTRQDDGTISIAWNNAHAASTHPMRVLRFSQLFQDG